MLGLTLNPSSVYLLFLLQSIQILRLYKGHFNMPIQLQQPTAYVDANLVISHLLKYVQNTLGKEFIGLYLHGSLALGDFRPASSDIDFFVVTHHSLSAKLFDDLATMHLELEKTNLAWLPKLEGSYIPLAAIHRYDPKNNHHPRYDYGTKVHLCGHGSDTYIQYHGLRKQGIVVAGPAPSTFMESISTAELRQASLGILQEWWLPKIEDTTYLHHPGYESYAILTMCRILYTLKHGEVASKPAAARWAQETLGAKWVNHIQRALDERGETSLNTVEKTVALIRYVHEYSQI